MDSGSGHHESEWNDYLIDTLDTMQVLLDRIRYEAVSRADFDSGRHSLRHLVSVAHGLLSEPPSDHLATAEAPLTTADAPLKISLPT